MRAVNEPNWALVNELTRLLNRFPKQDWDDLIAWLNDDEARLRTSSVVGTISRLRTDRSHQGSARSPSVSRVIDRVMQSDPKAAELLTDFRYKLLGRQMLPTAQELRAFAETIDIDVRPVMAKREQAVSRIIVRLAELPRDELFAAVTQAPSAPRDLGGEYERWARLIMGNKPSQD